MTAARCAFHSDTARFTAKNLKDRMELIWTTLIGLVAGKLAKMLITGSAPSVLFLTIALGIFGSVAATHIGPLIGVDATDHSTGLVASGIGSVVGALIGASILLLTHRFVAKK